MDQYLLLCCIIALLPLLTAVTFYLVTVLLWSAVLTGLIILPAATDLYLLWIATLPIAALMIAHAMTWLEQPEDVMPYTKGAFG